MYFLYFSKLCFCRLLALLFMKPYLGTFLLLLVLLLLLIILLHVLDIRISFGLLLLAILLDHRRRHASHFVQV